MSGIRIEDGSGYVGVVRALTFEGDVDPLALSDSGYEGWGRLDSEYVFRNLVSNVGRAQMVKLITAETTRTCTYMALSTSVVTPALADTVATIPDRKITQLLTIAQSYNTYYQKYVGYFSTVSFGSTGINLEALLDASSTAATTNLWADTAVTISKSTTQSLVIEHLIQATTGA